MKITAYMLIAAVLLLSSNTCLGQNTVEVSKPRLSMQGNRVLISYDILNSKSTELFSIRIEITNSTNELIPAHSLSGDIGNEVSGGFNKQILWNIEADSIFLDEEIFVQIFALRVTPLIVEEEPSVKNSPAEVQSYKRPVILAQSLLFPGWGLSRIKNKPHWIKGIMAYGCLGGSIYLNNQAYNDFSAYLESSTPNEASSLYDKAYSQDRTSRILAYSALGIWITDMVWTIIGSSDSGQPQSSENQRGFSIEPVIEPLSSAPMITLRYTF
jgi:hypothetical protein